jgi:hypothetical protein
MATQYANGKIVTSGLVLALDAADRNSYVSGSTVWNDMSGNGNTGTLTNGPTFSNNSIVFDGVDDSATIPYQSSLGLSSQGTLSVWCYPTTLLQDNYAGLVGMTTGGQANQQSYFLLWRKINNIIQAGIQNAGTYNIIQISLPTSIAWYNFVLTWNGTTINLYQNGISATAPISQTINAQTLNTFVDIGGKMFQGDNGGSGYFAGYIPITQIYNRGLTDTEVLQNYNAQKSRFNLK